MYSLRLPMTHSKTHETDFYILGLPCKTISIPQGLLGKKMPFKICILPGLGTIFNGALNCEVTHEGKQVNSRIKQRC